MPYNLVQVYVKYVLYIDDLSQKPKLVLVHQSSRTRSVNGLNTDNSSSPAYNVKAQIGRTIEKTIRKALVLRVLSVRWYFELKRGKNEGCCGRWILFDDEN